MPRGSRPHAVWFDELPPVPSEIPPGELPAPIVNEREAPCDGECVYGYDIVTAADGVSREALMSVAYPDPACSLHGIHLDEPEASRDLDEPYVRTGDMDCAQCGREYHQHETVVRYDGWDGQELILHRVCDGRLVKL